uniref:VWFA domain-containing protein n=1 Tax=Candidatus Kentrum sp. LPFa TaxID=2126335 RepID=A0A450VZW5_9GAMM|nr:MAG: hypothetical protein BECKLPF1236B_GA0070989_10137 [Candidatus Kentron sp. LPFa]
MASKSPHDMEIIRLGYPDDPPIPVQPGIPFPLSALPGEHWTTFHLVVDGEPQAVFQVETLGERLLNPIIASDGNGGVHVHIQGHRVLRFAPDVMLSPQAIKVNKEADRVDVAWVIDATQAGLKPARSEEEKNEKPPPAHAAWESHVAAMADLIDAMGSEREARMAMLTFGDRATKSSSVVSTDPWERGFQQISNIAHLTTPERAFRPMAGERLKELAGKMVRIDGDDYVDALAEALTACTGLAWNGERRIVIISGDSPGYSLAFPPPEAGVDTGYCRRDVDAAAMALHELGVEIMTVYLPITALTNPSDRIAKLLTWTQAQYQRLASLPEYVFVVGDGFAQETVLQALQDSPEVIGRSSAV